MRVQRAFAFVDVAGFSNLTARHGDERAVDVLVQFRALVRDICSRRGVRIAKWLGDGAMLVGVDTGPLVAAVLELQHAAAVGSLPAAVTCGVTCGRVILLEGDDYVGHAVNVAARLCDMATSPQVLATPAVAEALPPWGTVVAHHRLTLRGIDDPLDVVELALTAATGPTSPDPVCGIPLTTATAAAVRDGPRGAILLCSDSCLETWEGRRSPFPEEQGSVRVPLIGS